MVLDPFLIGIDGGGTHTRAVLADARGVKLAQGYSGPSGLALGIERAWDAIEAACRAAFAQADTQLEWKHCVLGCGLAGANQRDWLAAFIARAPPLAAFEVSSDAYTTVLGAHGGAPGVIVALGTGSIAAVLDENSVYRIVGGYGFPSGDEASGAWLGLQALAHVQQALDRRVAADTFSQALLTHIGIDDRDSLVAWSCNANQTAYASVAPIVIHHKDHPVAAALLVRAGREIGKMIDALDRHGTLPVALCGGLAEALTPYVPLLYRKRLREPMADSAHGAIQLALRGMARIRGSAVACTGQQTLTTFVRPS